MARAYLTALSALTGLAVLALALWLWGFGGAAEVQLWAAEAQRQAQSAMAQGLRALKAGQAGAWWSLMGICFTYGFFHAAGPGHGKLVLGGYGLARAVTLGRLAALALASSLAQAATAVLLVLAGVLIFDWGRTQLSDLAERMFAPLSYGLMALLGLYLLLRGLRRGLRGVPRLQLWRGRGRGAPASAASVPREDHIHASEHDHTHAPGEVCLSCGHRHAPTLEEAAHLSSLREALAIVLAIAARPCTGAVFLLLLTWRFGVLSAGIAGTFAMGLGTATVTLVVALLAAGLRGGLLARGLVGQNAGLRLAAVLEICAGGIVMLLCLQLLMRSL